MRPTPKAGSPAQDCAGFLTVTSTLMEPEIKMGDVVAYAPAERFVADDLYVLDPGIGPRVMRCQSFYTVERGPCIRCAYDVGAYDPWLLTKEQFQRFLVGQVFAIVHVTDRETMERLGISFAMPEGKRRPTVPPWALLTLEPAGRA